MTAEFRVIDCGVSFNDPEGPLGFRSDGDAVIVQLRDWRNREVSIRFPEAFRFSAFRGDGYCEFPDGCLLEVIYSDRARRALAGNAAGPDEQVRHFVVSTNEGQWCEVIGASYQVFVEGDQVAAG